MKSPQHQLKTDALSDPAGSAETGSPSFEFRQDSVNFGKGLGTSSLLIKQVLLKSRIWNAVACIAQGT